MATEFVVMLPGRFGKHSELALQALEQVETIEDRLSLYRAESDISRLNRAAGLGPVKVSADCLAVLRRAEELSRQTQGAFDVTAGPLVQAWGFTQRRGQKPAPDAVAQALAKVGFDRLRLDTDRGTAELLEPGMAVNLGAIGKGLALDRIADVLRAG
ncbi:MAG: FAD:protein FMN transferase, partial [Planctomycetaceae bacterium]